MLWPASPSAYRHRWDTLLRHLNVPQQLGLTPAGLRAGGAAQRYRNGVHPAELQWTMRLKHLTFSALPRHKATTCIVPSRQLRIPLAGASSPQPLPWPRCLEPTKCRTAKPVMTAQSSPACPTSCTPSPALPCRRLLRHKLVSPSGIVV